MPFYSYGQKNILGYAAAITAFAGEKIGKIMLYSMRPMLGIQVPVFKNATVGLKNM